MLNRLISKRVLFISALTVLAIAAVAFTFTQAVAYSAFAAAVLKVAIILLLYEALDRFLLEGVDTISELKDGNVAVAVTLLALALLLAPAVATGQPCPRVGPDRPAILNVALQEVGVTETPPGSNEGSRIETYMEAVGLSDGYPWCAGAMRWMMDQAKTDRPTVRSASATDYVTGSSIEATEVLRGTESVPSGALVIWRRGDTWKGHIGVVHRWHQRCGRTVEGNTSPGESGPQRDGDGVWARQRCIWPGSYFRIIAFTPTT
jgi:hypothetical protein